MRVFFLLVSTLLVGCANLSLTDVYRNPTFEYQSTKIAGVSFDNLAGTSVVQIRNSNPYQLPISQLNAQLWLEGEPWLALDNDAISGLPASGSVNVSFQWDLIFDQLLTRAVNVYQAGEADFTLKLSPTFTVPVLGPQTLVWSSDFTVPIPKLPKVSLQGWRLTNVSFSKLTLALDVAVFNPNVFSIATQGIKMDVGKDGRALADLQLRDANLQANGSSTQTVEVSLSIVDVGLTVVNALKSGQWPDTLAMNWAGAWRSPDLDFALPALRGRI